jgi:threonine dehydrogenase-like Zn-dependent dehydrogenase
MRGVVMHAPGDVRVEQREDPKIIEPTDAIIRLSATCVCGSDLWPYRGVDEVARPTPMGHEYAGIVEQVGGEVRNIRPGQFAIGSFFASDNTCEICQAGYQSSCVHRELVGGAQSQYMRVPLADGTLWRPPKYPTTSWCRASSRHPTSWAPAGSVRSPRRPARARQWRSSATVRSDCSGCSRPSSSARSGSSR